MNNVYLRNGVIATIANVVVFIIGWGCIVPDQLMDQTHLFGLFGSYEVIKGNTAVVFGVCSILTTLILIISLVEAIVEDFRPRCPTTRAEKRTKLPTGTFANNKMRIADPSPEKCEKVVDEDKDPKTPTLN